MAEYIEVHYEIPQNVFHLVTYISQDEEFVILLFNPEKQKYNLYFITNREKSPQICLKYTADETYQQFKPASMIAAQMIFPEFKFTEKNYGY